MEDKFFSFQDDKAYSFLKEKNIKVKRATLTKDKPYFEVDKNAQAIFWKFIDHDAYYPCAAVCEGVDRMLFREGNYYKFIQQYHHLEHLSAVNSDVYMYQPSHVELIKIQFDNITEDINVEIVTQFT